MKITTLLFALLSSVLVVGANAAEPVAQSNQESVRGARPPEDKEQLERRLASVATLIDKSSAAKQIESSAVPQALALREKARELRQQAEAAFLAGNYLEASRFLDQTAKMMFEGVRLAAPEQIARGKKQLDFDNRMESVKALLEAQKRISAEKNQGAKGTATSNRIEGLIRDAQALATAGKLDEGRALLDQVYVTTRTEIESMREGDTLVRSLNFATKEEEYRYEVDRNETHKMLVTVLLEEKRATNSGLDAMVKKYLEKSESLRLGALALADKKDFEGAIQMLEDSTKELVRAIRSAGVYIPG
jgi:cell division protein YceG involved in septum cleavage